MHLHDSLLLEELDCSRHALQIMFCLNVSIVFQAARNVRPTIAFSALDAAKRRRQAKLQGRHSAKLASAHLMSLQCCLQTLDEGLGQASGRLLSTCTHLARMEGSLTWT